MSTPAKVVSEYGTDTLFKAKRRFRVDDGEDEPSVAPPHRPAYDGAHIRSNASAVNGQFTPLAPPAQPLSLISSSSSPSTTSASTPSTSSLYAKKPSKPQVGSATTRTRRCRSSTASSRRRRAWSLALSVSPPSSSRHDSPCARANAIIQWALAAEPTSASPSATARTSPPATSSPSTTTRRSATPPATPTQTPSTGSALSTPRGRRTRG